MADYKNENHRCQHELSSGKTISTTKRRTARAYHEAGWDDDLIASYLDLTTEEVREITGRSY